MAFSYSKDVNLNKVCSQTYHLAYASSSFDLEISIKDIRENKVQSIPHYFAINPNISNGF
ncbi:hypothetical protein [Arenibacter sp. F20364]|uniref:hypothetical protein n=1 Tax=Arenibacter sp. F20364 TaxID=2926415 RepID=UPI001FF19C59|nr:hypothetical protein [Arenibacter sp. F20364]MCK0191579.1 hypothetical protein [Arenibacter sp. F20364]